MDPRVRGDDGELLVGWRQVIGGVTVSFRRGWVVDSRVRGNDGELLVG